MKIFVCCLSAALLSSAFAVTKYEEKTAKNKENYKTVDKSSDSKPKRDASLLVSSYHGPSYKYLPPSSVSSSFDSYAENSSPSSLIPVVYNSGIGNGYRADGTDQAHGHFGGFAHGQRNDWSTYGPGYMSKNNYHSSGDHHGLGYISGNFAGHAILPQSNTIKGGTNSLSTGSFGHKEINGGNVNLYALGHGYSLSENGYKSNSHSIHGGHKGKPTVLGSVYHSSNGLSSNFPSLDSNGFSSGHSLSSSLPEVQHSDHVHNGGQEHIYIIPSGSSNFGTGHHEVSELPNNSHFLPVQQQPIPRRNYGAPIINVSDTFNKKYHPYTSLPADQGPSYAAGHKGLGHFSFTANKPQAVHTSLSSSSLKLPSFSKAPFKPSTFLGIRYEENSHENFPYQQYVPSSSIVSNPTGYDYSTPHDNVATYQKENYPQSLELQSASKLEPDSTYLPASSNESPFNEISSPNGNYLPHANIHI